MKISSTTYLTPAIILLVLIPFFFSFVGCLEDDYVQKIPPSPELRFFQAIEKGDLAQVKELIDNGLSINVKDSLGNSGLMRSVDEEERDFVLFFLEKKANVNHRNLAGETALYRAVFRGNLEFVKLLVEAGAETKVKTVGGISLLELADERGEDSIYLYLKQLK